jgi:hypothetical protein
MLSTDLARPFEHHRLLTINTVIWDVLEKTEIPSCSIYGVCIFVIKEMESVIKLEF